MKRNGCKIVSYVLIISMIFSSIIVNAENSNQDIVPRTMVEVGEHETMQLNTENQQTIVEEEQEVNIQSVSEEGGIYESCLSYEIIGGEVVITDCDENATGEIVIPNTIEGFPVTSIGERAFKYCGGMTGITIPQCVVNIGADAFDDCWGLKAVYIEDLSAWCSVIFEEGGCTNPLTCMYAYLYINGEKATDIVIPEGVTSISEHAFNYYRGLTSISIPKSVTSIGWSAFNGCENLATVYVSDIEAWCNIDFQNANSNPLCNGADLYLNQEKVTEIVIPENITVLNESVFEGCTSISSVRIHKKVTSVGHSAFEECVNLQSVYIEDLISWCDIDFGVWCGNPLENGADLYLNEEKVVNLVIPKEVTWIRDSAFVGCGSIISVHIPKSVTSVGSYAFKGCSNLKKVYAEDLTAWCNMSFGSDGSNPLSNGADLYLNENKATHITIPQDVTIIRSGIFQGYTGLESITISENVENIQYYAFEGCTGLTDIDIPKGVNSIGSAAFRGCSSLTSIIVPEGVTCIESRTFEGCTGLTSVDLPSSINYIESGAFLNCESLASIEIPENVINIEARVFEGCTSLRNVQIPENVTEIEYRMFYACKNLDNVIIPENVSGIGIEAFYGCEVLTSINIPKNVTYMWDDAFAACENLETVYITDMETWCNIDFSSGANPLENGADLYLNNEKIVNLVIPEEVTNIGKDIFRGCTSVTSVTIPNGVTIIGPYSFAGCTNLINVSLPESIVSISHGAFWGCANLININIPSQTESIGTWTFSNCTSLESIIIPRSITSIGQDEEYDYIGYYGGGTFAGCEKLKMVYIDDISAWCKIKFGDSFSNPLSEGASLYVNGEKVTELTIPEGIENIGQYTFFGCTSLISLSISENVTSIGGSAFYGCQNLTEIGIPESVVEIDRGAFANCSSLVEINIPEGVEHIGSYAFWNCSKLARVYLPRGINYIGYAAFFVDEYGSIFSGTVYYSGNEEEWDTINKEDNIWEFEKIAVVCNYIGLNSNDIKIHATTNEIDADVKFQVTKIEEEKAIEDVTNSLGKFKINDCVLYDMTLTKDNIQVQPDGEITICIPVPENVNTTNCKVFYIDKSGNATDMNAVYENGYMVFNTDHFSYYALVELLEELLGDFDSTGIVDSDDAIHLLCNTLFGEDMYPLNQDADLNGDGTVDSDDAVYLLCNTLFGDELYPLNM